MFLDYHAVLVFLITGVAMVSAPLILGFLFRPSNPYPEKNMAYECAEDPIGPAQIRFDMRFYTTALIFIIFEVEIALMFPWARVFRDAPNQTLALGAGLIFMSIVFLGLVVDWVKGDLDWVKTFHNKRRVQD
ncbi:MAG: NADH-quinone oxidoreductase subunit A [Planctomycetota bacterium]|nr:NADH-quinone oxidoreductase subunit A [Planctomycetota bacterium]